MQEPTPQPRQRIDPWSVLFLALLVVGAAAAGYHLYSGRYANFVMASGAVALGAVIFATDRSRPSRFRRERVERQARASRAVAGSSVAWLNADRDVTTDTTSARITGGILAGVAAAVVAALAVFPAYMVAAAAGDAAGNQLERWFWGLTHNSLTNNVLDIPISAVGINLLAGLGWALVYTLLVEPRLSGPGWRRGLLFATVPWVLSLVVFFPVVGAGLFGANLGAGPLPAIGNLVLHLIYGATLGAVYCWPEVNAAEGHDSDHDILLRRFENEGIAFGLVGGLALGLIAGAALSVGIPENTIDSTNLILLSGGLGCAVGGVIGPFLGASYGRRHLTH